MRLSIWPNAQQPLATLFDVVAHAERTGRRLEQWGQTHITDPKAPVDTIVCTQKDLVKVRAARIAGLPLRAVQIDLHVSASEPLMQRLLDVLEA